MLHPLLPRPWVEVVDRAVAFSVPGAGVRVEGGVDPIANDQVAQLLVRIHLDRVSDTQAFSPGDSPGRRLHPVDFGE